MVYEKTWIKLKKKKKQLTKHDQCRLTVFITSKLTFARFVQFFIWGKHGGMLIIVQFVSLHNLWTKSAHAYYYIFICNIYTYLTCVHVAFSTTTAACITAAGHVTAAAAAAAVATGWWRTDGKTPVTVCRLRRERPRPYKYVRVPPPPLPPPRAVMNTWRLLLPPPPLSPPPPSVTTTTTTGRRRCRRYNTHLVNGRRTFETDRRKNNIKYISLRPRWPRRPRRRRRRRLRHDDGHNDDDDDYAAFLINNMYARVHITLVDARHMNVRTTITI